MTFLKKIRRIFSAMPRREKILVTILVTLFLVSSSKAIYSGIRNRVSSEQGVFAEGFVGHIRSLNPLFVDLNDADRDISRLIFSGLIKYDPKQKNFLPDLAEKWERDRNGLTYTFTLRKNILWHDEKSLNADDVIFTFKDAIQHINFRNPILKNAFDGIKINKIDDLTVTFTLTKPNSYFITNLTTGILPKHILENEDIVSLAKSDFNARPIGSGPYKLTSVRFDSDGDIIDLEAFEKYYGEQPTKKRVRFFTFPDEKNLIKERDALHAIAKLNSADKNIATIVSEQRFATYNYTLNQFTALHFNTTNNFLKEKSLRNALAFALNKDELIGEGDKRVDSVGLTNRSTEAQFTFDTAKAAKMLDELGFSNMQDGIRANNKGDKLEFNLLVLNIMPEKLSDNIKNQFQNIGVKININRMNNKDFFDYIGENRYDMMLIRHNLGYNRDFYPLLHSSQIIDTQKNFIGLNFSNFKSFRTDGLTEALRKEQTPSDKEKLMVQLSTSITDETPLVFISTPIYTYALDKGIPQKSELTNLNFHNDRFSIINF